MTINLTFIIFIIHNMQNLSFFLYLLENFNIVSKFRNGSDITLDKIKSLKIFLKYKTLKTLVALKYIKCRVQEF